MTLSKKNKYVLLHFSFSVLIAMHIMYLIFFIWYPQSLSNATGVKQIIYIMVIADVILGPILSWIIYKENKKTLKLELAIIIMIQIIALGYGLYTLAQARPAWIVYYKDGFELVQNNQIYIKYKNDISKKYEKISLFGPKYVAVSNPTSYEQKNHDIFLEMNGISVAQVPMRYAELELSSKDMQQYARNIKDLKEFNNQTTLMKVLSKYPQAKYFFPLKASFEDMTVLVDQDYKVIKIVDLRPWN